MSCEFVGDEVCFATVAQVTVASSSQRDSDEWASMLALAVPQYAAFFRCDAELSDRQLLVQVFDSKAQMNASIACDNGWPQTEDIVGGYTWRLDQRRVKSVLARQANAFYLRALMIHEMAHQFYFHSFHVNAGAELPKWFSEGTVEHLSLHAWDGSSLHLAVTPLVSLDSYAARALASARDFDVLATVGHDALNRPLGAYLVRFLALCFTDRFHAYCDAVQRRQAPAPESFFDWFGVSEAFFRFRLIEWLKENQERFTTLHRGWDSRGLDLLVAQPGVNEAIWCLCNDSVQLNEFTLVLVDKSAGGIMIDSEPKLFLWVEDVRATFKEFSDKWTRREQHVIQPEIEQDQDNNNTFKYRISIMYVGDFVDSVRVNDTKVSFPERARKSSARVGLPAYGHHVTYSKFSFSKH